MPRKNIKPFRIRLRHFFSQLFGKDTNRHPDWVFFGMALLLLVVGLIVLTSASSVVGLNNYQDSYYFFKQQLFQGVTLGLIGAFVLYQVSLSGLRHWTTAIFLGALVLLVLVLIPQFGDTRLGASRWLILGPISFQPAEVAKFAFVLYLASWLEKQTDTLYSFKETFLPFVMILGVVTGLVILQPDMGTMGVFVAIALTMFFAAGGSLWHIAVLVFGGVGVGAALIISAPYRAARFMTFLHPENDPLGVGYHINQALLAIGSGGVLGRGLGHSRQKFQYLPEVYGDSIFAVMAEELGFLITIFIISLFIYFFTRGFYIAKHTPDRYASLLVVGIMAWLGWQTLINIGAMVGILPLTGVPWPLVSYGSTALAINLASLGLVLNISQYMKQSR